MAQRPVFLPLSAPPPFYEERTVSFEWHPGFSLSQKQKSISSLHSAAAEIGIHPVLEISTKSPDPLGVALSAFNLTLKINSKITATVEATFQSSKIFQNGGPFTELINSSSKETKSDIRLKSSGPLTGFIYDGEAWPLEPKTAFYDWLYIKALNQNQEFQEGLLEYAGFTDIEFNPSKSFSCQARSAAIYVSLRKANLLDDALSSQKSFISSIYQSKQNDHPFQASLF